MAFARGQKIPLGPYQVVVDRAESVSGAAFGGRNSYFAKAGQQMLAVFASIDGVEASGAPQLRSYFTKVRLTDSEGRLHGGGLTMTVKDYQATLMSTPGGAPMDMQTMMSLGTPTQQVPREWVFLFTVPEKSRGFTLLLDNPLARDGQPGLAAVPVGR